MADHTKSLIHPQYSPHVLITGGSSGIGRCTAERLAAAGYTVYSCARRCEEKTEDFASGGSIINRHMDVTDPESIKAVISAIPDLGIVIHCAGFGVAGSCECIPIDRVRAQMETNYFGVLNVNQVALPRLREHKNSLVIVISSVAGFLSIPFQSHYSSSKYAVEAYVDGLRMEGRQFGIKATLVEPGDTKTEFTAARTHDEPPDSPYFATADAAVKQMSHDEENGVPPSKVVDAIVKMLGEKNPPIRQAVGADYRLVYWVKRLLPNTLLEWGLRKTYIKK